MRSIKEYEIKKHIYTQLEYEEYYAGIDRTTDEFIRKWGDIYLHLDAIFSNLMCALTIECVYNQV